MKGRTLLDARPDGRLVRVRDGARLWTALHRAYGEDAEIVVPVPRNAQEWVRAEETSRFLHGEEPRITHTVSTGPVTA